MLKQWEKRVIVFQTIYSCIMKDNFDINNIKIDADIEIYKIIYYGLINFEDIKKKIIIFLNKSWTWERISQVDQAIIIATYSEFFILNIKKEILIDQAIITSKNYSDGKSYKFINYILDRILNAKV